MRGDADAFLPPTLEHIQAQSFLRRIDFHDHLPSTNDLALEIAQQDDLNLPLLVLTARQTAGRGRGRNHWMAGRGALTFSLVVETPAGATSTHGTPVVSLTLGMAVCRALKELLPENDFGLKWPNDVYLDGRKVSGMLIETSARRPDRLVAGIGINVNNSFLKEETPLRETATSLFDVSRTSFALSDVLIRVLNQVAEQLQTLGSGEDRLTGDWQALCLLTGQMVYLECGSRSIAGICQGIENDGSLVLRTEYGIERVHSGVITRFGPVDEI